MADIPVEVATNILQRVVDRGIYDARYLCRFNDIVADFEKEKKRLEAKQQSVKDLPEQSRNRTENISVEVQNWLEDADSLTRKDTKERITCFFGCFPNCIRRYSWGKDLERKTRDIKRLSIEYDDIKIFSLPSELRDIECESSNDFVQFQSREVAYERLMKALKEGDNNVIGLHGSRGAGKTTLAIKVGDEVMVSNCSPQPQYWPQYCSFGPPRNRNLVPQRIATTAFFRIFPQRNATATATTTAI